MDREVLLMRRKFLSGSLFVFALVGGITVSAGTVWAQGQNADLILHNGKILTVNSNFSTAEAVAISGILTGSAALTRTVPTPRPTSH